MKQYQKFCFQIATTETSGSRSDMNTKALNGNIIYQIKNLKTGQCYVGRTCDFTRRRRQHFKALKNGKHSSSFLQRAYNKYGDEAFQMEALCHGLSKEKAKSIEQKLLDQYYHELYNCSRSAVSSMAPGDKHTEATKRKMSAAKKGAKNAFYGKQHTEEAKARMSASHKGKRKGAKNHMYAPFQVTFPDGTVVRWETQEEAAAAYGVSYRSIGNYLNGTRTPGRYKRTAHLKRTIWQYI